MFSHQTLSQVMDLLNHHEFLTVVINLYLKIVICLDQQADLRISVSFHTTIVNVG